MGDQRPETKPLTDGQRFEVPFPFVRDVFTDVDEEGSVEVPTCKPGTRYENTSPEGTTTYADGMGRVILTVVSTHKPGKYPQRVFYTRTWVDPDGKSFGKTKCRVATAGAFRSQLRGYRHEFAVKDCACGWCKWPFEDHRRTLAEAVEG